MVASPVSAEVRTQASLIGFRAPYLIERLLKEGIAASAEEGEDLFLEFKRWLLLSQSDRSKLWPMFSFRVDEVWHQFILYTREYTQFCEDYLGRYVHHAPSNSPRYPEIEGMSLVSFEEFAQAYGDAFGTEPPHVWHAHANVTLHRRVAHSHTARLQVRVNDLMLQMVNPEARRFLVQDEDQTYHLITGSGAEILRVGKAAGEALEFLVNTTSFDVRELPGSLDDGKKIDLISVLMELGILRFA